MLGSAQQLKKFDLDYYVINNQWFRVAYIFLCNFPNKNSQTLPTKTPPGNPITDYNQKERKKKKEKKFEIFLQAFTRNFS